MLDHFKGPGDCGGMDRHLTLCLILLIILIDKSEACFCDHYPWAHWSSCSKSCNSGTQSRWRQIVVNDYYRENSCDELCTKQQTRQCNLQTCPINCVLGDYGTWSDCDPCTEKQVKVRSVLRPSQFGGQPCTEPLVTFQPCVPSKLCKIEETDCKNKFLCDSGRCIPSKLECNGENDCGDNSDERDCGRTKPVCPRTYAPIPSVQLMGTGFHFLAGEPRGEVLDNSFTGGICKVIKSSRTSNPYRIPANLENINFEVQAIEDDLKTDFYKDLTTLGNNKNEARKLSGEEKDVFNVPIFYSSKKSESSRHNSAFKKAIEASHKKDSSFVRIHKVIKVLNFTMKKTDLQLSDVFLKALARLPLEYNSALYSRIFDDFGTHYFTSGSLGGKYDLLYQFSRQELKNSEVSLCSPGCPGTHSVDQAGLKLRNLPASASQMLGLKGLTEEQTQNCVRYETKKRFLFFTKTYKEDRCTTNKLSEKYEGSFLQGAEKSISLVQGGRSLQAAALAWEKGTSGPEQNVFSEWLESVKENPAVVDYELAPITDLVRNIPCAVTKRNNLRKALQEYAAKFDPCQCAPCPNNGRPRLLGTECLCVCQSGTYGENCESRSPDYKSVGQPCISDDEEMKEVDLAEPEADSGCPRPPLPENAFIWNEKRLYSVGEEVEISCLTGFKAVGYQYFRCLPDRTWRQGDVECQRTACLKPVVQDVLTISPFQRVYKIGESIELTCPRGFTVAGPSRYTCEGDSWTPPISDSLTCKKDILTKSMGLCRPGQKQSGSECICMSPEEDCRAQTSNCVCLLPPQCSKDENQLYCVKVGSSMRGKTVNICTVGAVRCANRRVEILNPGRCSD
ncbi:Complement component C6 [Apodemus speciosus]|uniref:Complement component C6 n=1 Tax=Apodemus speciosus TaxID=105296 RepID=A0ABQ0FIZ8_APOSI